MRAAAIGSLFSPFPRNPDFFRTQAGAGVSWPASFRTSPLVPSRTALALRQSPIPPLRKLAVEESDETVVLVGSVGSYYLKQLAQETVMPHLDGKCLVNRVTVIRTAHPVNAH